MQYKITELKLARPGKLCVLAWLCLKKVVQEKAALIIHFDGSKNENYFSILFRDDRTSIRVYYIVVVVFAVAAHSPVKWQRR